MGEAKVKKKGELDVPKWKAFAIFTGKSKIVHIILSCSRSFVKDLLYIEVSLG